MSIAESMTEHAPVLTPAPGDDTQDLWDKSHQFTNNVCFDNKSAYAMVHKTAGQRCGPDQDCDKIIERVSPHRIYDMVVAGGSTAQRPSFNDTGHVGTPAMFSEPAAYDGEPEPTPTPEPCEYPAYPGDEPFDELGEALFKDYETAEHAPDPGMGRWFGRTEYDWLTGICETLAESIVKHQDEWRDALNEWRKSLGKAPITNW